MATARKKKTKKPKSPFAAWLGQSKGDFPKEGVAGVETDWFDVGTVTLTGSKVAVTDLWMLWVDEDTVTAKLPTGKYAVRAKGIEFGRHRRVARVSLAPAGIETKRGRELGEVAVDSWGVAIGEIEAWHRGLANEQIGDFNESRTGVYADGCEIVRWEIAGRKATLVIAFTGLGDGGYPVRALVSGRKAVGLEVEFIPDGFKME
jgi:hypothetical protein